MSLFFFGPMRFDPQWIQLSFFPFYSFFCVSIEHVSHVASLATKSLMHSFDFVVVSLVNPLSKPSS